MQAYILFFELFEFRDVVYQDRKPERVAYSINASFAKPFVEQRREERVPANPRKKISKKIILMGGGGYNPWICLRAWIYNLATLINRIDLLKLNSESKYFLKSLKWKKEPKQEWITSIIDYPNIFN